MTKGAEWWRNTAQHMWRTYFAIQRMKQDDPASPLSPAESRTFDICDRVFNDSFVKSDQNILVMYFSSRWGDDLYTVEDYSLKYSVPPSVIWMVIRRANRLVMENIGILDPKDDEHG